MFEVSTYRSNFVAEIFSEEVKVFILQVLVGRVVLFGVLLTWFGRLALSRCIFCVLVPMLLLMLLSIRHILILFAFLHHEAAHLFGDLGIVYFKVRV